MLDAVRQGNAAVVVVGELRLIVQRAAGGVEAGQVGGAAGLSQAVQESRPCACVKVVPRLCVHQNGVLRRLGGCVLQQLQAGVKAGGQLRFGGQGVDQLCRLGCFHRHGAAGALAACHSRNGAAARLAGRHSAVYNGGNAGWGHRPDDAFIGGVRRQHGGGQGLALALVQGQGAAAQADALHRNIVTATAATAAAPLGAQGVQLRLHGGAGVGGVFQKGQQQGLAGLAQAGARIRIFISFCNTVLHVIQLRSGKHFAVCKVLLLIAH